MEIMSRNKLLNTCAFICLALFCATSSASDGEWVRPFMTDVSNTYNVRKEGYSISVTYSCEYKVNGYIQELAVFINENFLGGDKFDLDSEIEIEFIRDDNKLFSHQLTEEELLNVLAERKANIKLATSRFRGSIPLSQVRQTMSDNKKINGVPISNLIETGKEFGLRVLIDSTEMKRVPVNLGFVVENKFKGIVRSCESGEQLKATMEDSKRQLLQEEERRNLIGLAILFSLLALGLLSILLNTYINKRRSNNSTH